MRKYLLYTKAAAKTKCYVACGYLATKVWIVHYMSQWFNVESDTKKDQANIKMVKT